MPLYTIEKISTGETQEFLSFNEESAKNVAMATMDAAYEDLRRVHESPAGVVFKKTGADRGATRKSTWRKANR